MDSHYNRTRKYTVNEPSGHADTCKALKHTRLYPGNDKLICDFLQRKAAGVWNPGYEIGLARYLKTRAWEAPIVPRPTRLTLQEERDKRELEKFLNDEPTYSESRDGKDPF